MPNDYMLGPGFDLYMSEIKGTRLLAREEEVALSRRVHEGDDEAKWTLFHHNLRLAARFARRFYWHVKLTGTGALDVMDCVQHANLGLMRAIEKYDGSRGFKFSTYATWWIRQSCYRGWQGENDLMRRPIWFADRVSHFHKVRKLLIEELERMPTNAEIAARMSASRKKTHKTTERQVEELAVIIAPLVYMDAASTTFEDSTRDTAKLSNMIPADIIPADVLAEDAQADEQRRMLIWLALGKLDDRERLIISHHFGLVNGTGQKSLQQIGQVVGVTRERVRQIELKALAKLRDVMKESNRQRELYASARE